MNVVRVHPAMSNGVHFVTILYVDCVLQGEEVPLADMPYPDGGSHAPPPGAFRMYPNQQVS